MSSSEIKELKEEIRLLKLAIITILAEVSGGNAHTAAGKIVTTKNFIAQHAMLIDDILNGKSNAS